VALWPSARTVHGSRRHCSRWPICGSRCPLARSKNQARTLIPSCSPSKGEAPMKRKKITIKKEALELCKKLTHYTYAEAMSEAKKRGLSWMQCDTCHLMRCNEVGSEQANEEVETAKHWI